jgi:CHAT domain-containing protein
MKIRNLLILLFAFTSCNLPDNGKIHDYSLCQIDSIKFNAVNAYNSKKQSLDYLTWLSENGAYYIALETIKDSIKENKKNELAIKGYNIALQHGYYDEALSFLQYVRVKSKEDSIDVLLKSLSVYLKEIDTLKESEFLNKLLHYRDEISHNDKLKFELLSDSGTHFHNLHHYKKAINLNANAYRMAKRLRLSESELALTCQRLANDYNDQLRYSLIRQGQRIRAYNKAKELYKETISLLNKISPIPKERLSESYMTLNMLDLAVNYSNDTFANYKKAIELILPQFNDPEIHDNYFCYHPILTNIILTHLAEVNHDRFVLKHTPEKAVNSIRWSEICSKLLQQAVMEPNDFGVAFDMLKVFRTRNTSQYISYLLTVNPDQKKLPLSLLKISTQDKYPILSKNHLINKGKSNRNLLRLRLLNAIRSLQFLSYNIGDKRLNNYADSLENIALQINNDYEKELPTINKKNIEELQQYLRDNNSIVVSFQYSQGNLLRITINKDSIAIVFKPFLMKFMEPQFGNALLNFEETNNVREFAKLGGAAYTYLFADIPNLLTYTKLIIVPDKLLPQSFDGLVVGAGEDYTWNSIQYLGDKICTYYVPNIQWLFNTPKSLNLNITYAVAHPQNQNQLPYSDLLSRYLKDNYDAEIINANDLEKNNGKSYSILHIATHTESDDQGFKNLLLDNSKLSSLNSYAPKCNMAILNACETIKGKYLMNEGAISLARLFLSSGADATISSTLKVDNNASAELFKYFYQFLYNGNTFAESLFKAKKEIRKRTAEWNNPYYWSSYQLLGKDIKFTH